MVCDSVKNMGQAPLISTSRKISKLHSRCKIKRTICSRYRKAKRRLFPRLCRICFEDRTKGRLISPCSCSGSLRSIHSDCLKTWILTRSKEKGYSKLYNSNVCEICHSLYNVKMVKTPGTFQQYCTSTSKRSLQLDVLMSILFTILVSLSFIFLSSHTEDYLSDEPATFAGIFILVILLLILYCLWIYVVVKSHLLRWVIWSYRHPQHKLQKRKDTSHLEKIIIS